MKSYLKEYRVHKSNAAYREIEFLLSYEEWLQIWIDSGRLSERGKGSIKYCMARYGDVGPYAVGNVSIVTNSKNISEGNLGKPASEKTRKLMSLTNVREISQKQKESISVRHKGKKLASFHIEALRMSNIGRKRIVSPETRKKMSDSAKARCAKAALCK